MLTIFLRRFDGKGERIKLREQSTLVDLTNQVEKYLSKDKATKKNSQNKSSILDHYCLFHKGSELEQAKSQRKIIETGIINNSIIHISPKDKTQKTDEIGDSQIKLAMIIRKRRLCFEVNQKSSIAQFKENICRDLNVSETSLSIVYMGIELNPSKCIADYHFTEGTLLSAQSSVELSSLKYLQGEPYGEASQSSEYEPTTSVKKVKSYSPKRLKKAESLNVDKDSKKNINVFCSLQLKSIDEKVDESQNQSRQTDSFELLEIDQQQELQVKEFKQVPKRQPLTGFFTGANLTESGDIKETQSIVADEQGNKVFILECCLTLKRKDGLKEFTFKVENSSKFEEARQEIAKIQKTAINNIQFIFNLDETSKSNITNSHSQYKIEDTPKSVKSDNMKVSKRKTQMNFKKLQQNTYSMRIMEKANKLRKELLVMEYEKLDQQKLYN